MLVSYIVIPFGDISFTESIDNLDLSEGQRHTLEKIGWLYDFVTGYEQRVLIVRQSSFVNPVYCDKYSEHLPSIMLPFMSDTFYVYKNYVIPSDHYQIIKHIPYTTGDHAIKIDAADINHYKYSTASQYYEKFKDDKSRWFDPYAPLKMKGGE